jgi:two-component system, OmpR family, phosphate regulon sensor histidine kinase PhoR
MDPATHTRRPPGGDASARDLLILASEELRGPLTSVTGYLNVLLDGEVGELTEGQARMAEIAVRNAGRLERFLDDLIVVAQVHADGLAPVRGPVDLSALARERVAAARDALRERGVVLSLAVGPCPEVLGDLPALAHMLDHMLGNAVGFVEYGGAIEVRVQGWRDGAVLVEVRDDGIPLEADDLPRLFTLRPEEAASGPRAMLASRIGLHLVRAVAEAHGGIADARVEDEATVLRVLLPGLDGSGGGLRTAG